MGESNLVQQIEGSVSYHWTTAAIEDEGMFDNIISYKSPMLRPALRKLHKTAKQMKVTIANVMMISILDPFWAISPLKLRKNHLENGTIFMFEPRFCHILTLIVLIVVNFTCVK